MRAILKMYPRHRSVSVSVALLTCLAAVSAAHGQSEVGPVLIPANLATPAAVDAHPGVRIVRLSQVKGDVLMDRRIDHGFESAFANLPITQGSKLKTGQGVAEVELEDNTTLRLTPETTIEFTDLRRDASGHTFSTVNVVEGTLFVSTAPTRGNELVVTSSQGKLTVAPSTHIHFHVGTPQTTAAVLDGSVQAQVGANTTVASKKTTLMFDPANQAAPTLVSHLDKTPYDSWDKSAVDYHKRYMNTSSFGNSGNTTQLYGLSDLNYYGSFSDAGGCGSMWRPYLASAGWDPYGNGILAYYQGAGYSWVSPYPWGWTPYHSGNWINCPGTGWGWQPGGTYYGLANMTTPSLQKRGIIPPAPPKHGHITLVAVNSQPLAISKFVDANTFVFNKDSAGLGVPRETFGKLQKISSSTLEHGSVTRAAYVAPVSPSMRAGQPGVSFARSGVNPALGGGASRGGWSGLSNSAAGNSSFSSASSASLSAGAASAHGVGVSTGGVGAAGAHK